MRDVVQNKSTANDRFYQSQLPSPKRHLTKCFQALAQPIGLWNQSERFECVRIREVVVRRSYPDSLWAWCLAIAMWLGSQAILFYGHSRNLYLMFRMFSSTAQHHVTPTPLLSISHVRNVSPLLPYGQSAQLNNATLSHLLNNLEA